jgi:hypothetical protein
VQPAILEPNVGTPQNLSDAVGNKYLVWGQREASTAVKIFRLRAFIAKKVCRTFLTEFSILHAESASS